MKKIPFSIILLIFTISFASLGMEITITRIFSLVFSYYYLFLAVSIAMCGLGLGGFLASARQFRETSIKTIAIILAFSYILTIVIPLKIPFFLSHPLILSAVFLLPFLFTGFFIALVFKFYYPFSGVVYFADLIGAGLGSILIITLLSVFSPINIVLLYSVLVLFITFIVSRKFFVFLLQIIFIALIILNWRHKIIDVPYRNIPISQGTKELIVLLQNNRTVAQIEKTYWSPSFRTDVVCEPLYPNTRGIFIDGSAPTIMFKFDGDLNSIKWLKNTFNFFPFAIAKKGDALCIGSGGGLDILLGLLADFKKVEAVEINDCIPKILEDYKTFNGGILKNEKVEFFLSEGRSFLKRTPKQYDLIYLALVQTKTSSKLGLPLVESYLHTTDAYVDYFAHLKPEGMVALLCETKYFLQRIVFNVILALNKMDIDFLEAKNHLIIIANPVLNSPYKYLLLLKRTRFEFQEAKDIMDQANSHGFFPHYYPYLHAENFFGFSSLSQIEIYLAETRQKEGVDLSPTTDEKPLFYDLSPNAPPFLYYICITTLLLSLVTIVVVKPRVPLRYSAYFLLLGAGFMILEVSLTQKFLFFLGTPLTTFSVIILGLLSGSGIGSFLSQGFKDGVKKLPIFLSTLCLAIILLFFFLKDIFLISFCLTDFLRSLLSFIILFALGLLLGIPFPTGMKQFGRISSPDIGYMWGINGLMSIFGSSLSIIISKIYGIKYSILLAFLIYLSVLLISIKFSKDH